MQNWKPSAGPEQIRQRAAMLREIREFFFQRGVLEVETPTLSRAAVTDPALSSLETRLQCAPGIRYLHTSPEFPMKRLLAAGAGDIYQICRVFRDGELGRLHNPEFSMLEWYRLGWDYQRLMVEVVELLSLLLGPRLREAPQWLSYGEAFERFADISHVHQASADTLAQHASAMKIEPAIGQDLQDVDSWRDLILTSRIEPHLGQDRLTLLYDYPVSQAALAKISQSGDEAVAERFEVYFGGVELGNGFTELVDAVEQRRRFEADLRLRQAQGLAPVPLDEHFLESLAEGLPECAGVALGLDRILMARTEVEQIADVLTFPEGRA